MIKIQKHQCKAFTLMELLIVITVIAILGAGISLSTIGVLNTADADAILNNMQQIKTATLIWYKNNISRVVLKNDNNYQIKTNGKEQLFSNFIKDHGEEILKYLNTGSIKLRSKNDTGNTGDYALIAVNKTANWYVCCNLSTTKGTELTKGLEAPEIKIKEKIAAKASTLNLFGVDNLTNDSVLTETYTDQKYVCMPIIELNK